MPLFKDTVPMEVEVPAWGEDAQKSTYTQLFRVGLYHPETYRVAIQRKGSTDLSVDFGACSVGAQVDDFLAQYNNDGYQGVVEATGYDINGSAVSLAQRGVHTVVGEQASTADRYREVLEKFGFEVDVHPEAGQEVLNGAGIKLGPTKIKLLTANAAPVRGGHRISFVRHDLLEPLSVGRERDIVFLNNFLYHLSDEQAAQVIRNLGATVAEHGVLSLGLPHVTPENQEVLEKELGMEPVLTAFSGTVPVVFGRS